VLAKLRHFWTLVHISPFIMDYLHGCAYHNTPSPHLRTLSAHLRQVGLYNYMGDTNRCPCSSQIQQHSSIRPCCDVVYMDHTVLPSDPTAVYVYMLWTTADRRFCCLFSSCSQRILMISRKEGITIILLQTNNWICGWLTNYCTYECRSAVITKTSNGLQVWATNRRFDQRRTAYTTVVP
jgi:hypothetical protein